MSFEYSRARDTFKFEFARLCYIILLCYCVQLQPFSRARIPLCIHDARSALAVYRGIQSKTSFFIPSHSGGGLDAVASIFSSLSIRNTILNSARNCFFPKLSMVWSRIDVVVLDVNEDVIAPPPMGVPLSKKVFGTVFKGRNNQMKNVHPSFFLPQNIDMTCRSSQN